QKRMYKDAAYELQQGLMAEGDEETAASLARAYAASSYLGMMNAWLSRLDEQSSHLYVESITLAGLNVSLGKRDRAFMLLERAYAERDPGLTVLKVEPEWDNLRSDPRFADLMRRVGLAK